MDKSLKVGISIYIYQKYKARYITPILSVK